VISVKLRTRKVASTLLRLLRVQIMKSEKPGLRSLSPERGKKVKRNGLRQRELV